MIKFKKVSKSYKTSDGERKILNDLCAEIPAGSIAAITGPSGSGKSTFLHLAGILDAPDSGTVEVAGTDAAALSAKEALAFRNKKIGFVFQHHFLIPELSVWQNIAFPAMINEGAFTGDLKTRAFEVIEFLRLSKVAESYPEKLSGGESQRTAIARAVFNNPDILIMDEPTGSLDHELKSEVIKLISTLNRASSTTIVIATHDEAVKNCCSFILNLSDISD
ncbi:MAG TPA: ABC transporter ATP-binding protein [Candidatus Wallbacteria bacterium]|nr:ABC transporter ATP-binding protein [Candidatus Wallbacteria bacterium]